MAVRVSSCSSPLRTPPDEIRRADSSGIGNGPINTSLQGCRVVFLHGTFRVVIALECVEVFGWGGARAAKGGKEVSATLRNIGHSQGNRMRRVQLTHSRSKLTCVTISILISSRNSVVSTIGQLMTTISTCVKFIARDGKKRRKTVSFSTSSNADRNLLVCKGG